MVVVVEAGKESEIVIKFFFTNKILFPYSQELWVSSPACTSTTRFTLPSKWIKDSY